MLDLLVLLVARPPTDAGVWLDAPPKPGTAIVAPLDVRGEAQAPEGVLRVELYVVRGPSATLVSSYAPAVPLGPVPFAFRWDPAGTAPGSVTIRVVATTLLRGFSADVPGLVLPAPAAPAVVLSRPAPAPRPAARPATPVVAVAPVYDDSGAAFGATATVLPYAPAATPVAPVATTAAVAAAPVEDRRPWASLAGGLLLLLVCSHLHRILRSTG